MAGGVVDAFFCQVNRGLKRFWLSQQPRLEGPMEQG